MITRDTDRSRLLMLLCAGATLALATLGCTNARRGDAARSDTTRSTAAGRTPDDSALSDVDIASIVLAANTADSSAGALAATRGRSPAVRRFGEQMVRDHGQLNQHVAALAGRLGISPVESEEVRAMKGAARDQLRSLQRKQGSDFDGAYLEHEVLVHESLLADLDQKLIAAADHPDLRQLLTQARATVQSHLEQARQISGSLR